MIGTTIWDYIHIKWWIVFLSAITPLSTCYCSWVLLKFIVGFDLNAGLRLPWPLELWTLAEVAFYFFVHVPYRKHLQHPAKHPPASSREKRQKLFQHCQETIEKPESYLRKWFLGSPLEDIKKDNLKEFYLWAFFNRGGDPGQDDEELEHYIAATEEWLGRRFEDGRGNAVCLRLTLDEVKMLHRSLLWYWCVGFVDCLSCIRFWYHGFHPHRTALVSFFRLFPWRPLALLSRRISPARHLSYWHRPHTSTSKLPILFVHGIGIGLYPYIDFLAELNEQGEYDNQIGIIAVEIMPISFRITHSMLEKDVLCSEIHEIIRKHGWSDFVLVSHSYGSAISTHLVNYKPIAEQISAVVLIDPITFLLHLPDVAYNFTIRKPKAANEHQLYYFASMDMGVSHALSRCFFWSENILWKEELNDRPVTVSLASNDLIVNTASVRRYLETSGGKMTSNEKSRHQSGIEVIWNDGIDHAQVFDTARRRRRVIDAIRGHCGCTGWAPVKA
jgi:pimeloyl-ACP methyl ester carboxylesterase